MKNPIRLLKDKIKSLVEKVPAVAAKKIKFSKDSKKKVKSFISKVAPKTKTEEVKNTISPEINIEQATTNFGRELVEDEMKEAVKQEQENSESNTQKFAQEEVKNSMDEAIKEEQENKYQLDPFEKNRMRNYYVNEKAELEEAIKIEKNPDKKAKLEASLTRNGYMLKTLDETMSKEEIEISDQKIEEENKKANEYQEKIKKDEEEYQSKIKNDEAQRYQEKIKVKSANSVVKTPKIDEEEQVKKEETTEKKEELSTGSNEDLAKRFKEITKKEAEIKLRKINAAKEAQEIEENKRKIQEQKEANDKLAKQLAEAKAKLEKEASEKEARLAKEAQEIEATEQKNQEEKTNLTAEEAAEQARNKELQKQLEALNNLGILQVQEMVNEQKNELVNLPKDFEIGQNPHSK